MATNTFSPYAPQSITMFTVHGEEGATAFPVAPGQKVTLIDDMVFRKPPVQDIPQAAPAMSKDEIVNEVNAAVKAAMQKYFPQINFND